MPLRMLIFGRQGAGKGTQCEKLVAHYGAVHISTGDMLRDAAAAGTPLGLEAKAHMDAGDLLPDELIVGLVSERLRADDVTERGFILDGFPRTVAQAEALWSAAGDAIELSVFLEVPLDEVRNRMLERARPDDTPEAIENRLQQYEQQTVPAIEWIGARGVLHTVDGVGEVDEVFARLRAVIDGATGPT